MIKGSKGIINAYLSDPHYTEKVAIYCEPQAQQKGISMIRPKIGLDWDDVTAPFNSIAIDMANKKYNITPPLELEDIDSWENTGRASVIKEF